MDRRYLGGQGLCTAEQVDKEYGECSAYVDVIRGILERADGPLTKAEIELAVTGVRSHMEAELHALDMCNDAFKILTSGGEMVWEDPSMIYEGVQGQIINNCR